MLASIILPRAAPRARFVGGRRAAPLACAALPHRGIVENNETTMPASDPSGEFRLAPRGLARFCPAFPPARITMKNNGK
jgi:hypothetical protein